MSHSATTTGDCYEAAARFVMKHQHTMKTQNKNWNSRPIMQNHLPPGKHGTAAVNHFTLSKNDIFLDNLRYLRNGTGFMVASPGKFVRLVTNEVLQMSDTDMEWRTNREFLINATGDILIAGLGIGFVLVPLLCKPGVNSITVVEKNPDVISLVAPHFKNKKLKVVNADIYQHRDTLNGDKFDTIYFDIWGDLNTDNLDQMTKLHRTYRSALNRKNPMANMGSWSRPELQTLKRRGW